MGLLKSTPPRPVRGPEPGEADRDSLGLDHRREPSPTGTEAPTDSSALQRHPGLRRAPRPRLAPEDLPPPPPRHPREAGQVQDPGRAGPRRLRGRVPGRGSPCSAGSSRSRCRAWRSCPIARPGGGSSSRPWRRRGWTIPTWFPCSRPARSGPSATSPRCMSRDPAWRPGWRRQTSRFPSARRPA